MTTEQDAARTALPAPAPRDAAVAPSETPEAPEHDSLPLRGYCWSVAALTVVLALVVLARGGGGPAHRTPVLLAVLALAAACTTLSVVTARRPGTGAAVWDVTWLWLFCAAVVLPLRETLLLSVVLLLDAGLASRRPWHRASLYWTSSVVALLVARVVVGWGVEVLPVGRLAAAVVAAAVVQLGLVGLALVVESRVWRWPADLIDRDGVLSELVCLTVAALLATSLRTSPGVVVLVVPVLLLVQGSFQLPELRHDARQDSKTGLDTAARWRERAAAGLEELARSGRPAAVLLLDVDRFKSVNDSAGHLAGDAVLAAVARVLAGQVRDGDVLGRFGGDEFVAMLRDVDVDRAREVGERMRRAVAGVAVQTTGVDGTAVRIDDLTISVGVAGTAGPGHALDLLVLAADGALLAAKQSGRDRVRTA